MTSERASTQKQKTMKKRAYIQPTTKQITLSAYVILGPIASQQYDKGAHSPLGIDDNTDNFMSREWDDYDDEDE